MSSAVRPGSFRQSQRLGTMLQWLLPCIFLLLGVSPARAQADLRLSLGTREIEVGESVEVELTAMGSSDEKPIGPELAVPAGFKVRGPQVGTRSQVSITNFKMVRRAGLTATWRVTPNRPGLFSLGPASVQVAGNRQQSVPVQLKVVPAGQLAQQRKRRRRARPDPFARNSPFDDLFDQMRRGGSRTSRLPQAPRSLVLRSLPDQTAFLHAVVSPKKAVVGQQITLSVYAYGARGIFQEAAGSREASYSDFLAQRLVEDPSQQPVYQFESGGQDWIVVKVREVALFPLRTGNLEIGATQFGFLGRRYSGRASRGLIRKSQAHRIEVQAPPLAGRPPGYNGEVGRFRLSATVEPREVVAGGSLSVKILVKGKGRLPARINLPEQGGVQWDEPTVHDSRRNTGTEVVGERSFQYVVRMTQAGDVSLGSLKLPYFNPATSRYAVARVALGRVIVAQASRATQEQLVEPEKDRLSRAIAWRPYDPQVNPAQPSSRGVADSTLFWWLLFAGPGATGLLMAAVKLWARGKLVRTARADSLASQALRALAQARQALAEQQLDTALQRMERAVYCGAQEVTGLRGRGILRTQLSEALQAAGLSLTLSQEVVRVLDSFDAVRFSGELTQGEILMQQVSELLEQLLRRQKRKSSSSALSSGLLVFLALFLVSPGIHAKQAPNEGQLWKQLQSQIQKGDYSSAIDQLELWSDQGRTGRDLSFNRGVAYLGRAESSAQRASDWGQAVAAFQEAALLDPEDEQAAAWVATVRGRLSEERAKLRGSRVEARPRLLRALVDLIGERWWAGLSLLGSLALTLGLWLHWLAKGRVSPTVSVLLGSVGLVLLIGAGAMTAVSVQFRTAFAPAVVIVEEARWLNASGLPLSPKGAPTVEGGTGDRISMGSLLYIVGSRGALARVQWGDREGFVRATALRRLAH